MLLSIKGADVGTALLEGMSFPNAKSAFDDEVFRTALDLYGAHFTETSAWARLLTLVMVLETLAEPNTRPTIVLELLNRFRPQLEEVEAGMDPDSDAAFALDSLKRELFFRKDDWIRSRIRAFVADALTESESEHRELARLAVRVHDRRSTLVHRGMLHNDELTTAVADAKRIVEKVLSAEFIRLTDSDN